MVGRPPSRVSAAAREVEIVEPAVAVVRAEVEELVEGVFQIEGGPEEDRVVRRASRWG